MFFASSTPSFVLRLGLRLGLRLRLGLCSLSFVFFCEYVDFSSIRAAFVVRSVFFRSEDPSRGSLWEGEGQSLRQGNGNGTESPLSMVALAAEQPGLRN